MFYEKTREPELRDELFKMPSSEYRAAPFWAWNCKLEKEKLKEQVKQFREMGMGGFHVHCRVGLDTEYMGQEFMECVHAVQEESKKEGLRCYLYDEDRWPSGDAGGIVTKDLCYRTRFLVFSPYGYKENPQDSYMSAAKAVRSDHRKFLAAYQIILDEEGYLSSYRRVAEDASGDDVWIAHLEISGDTPWFNNQAYVNTLDKKALDKFIEVTHEKYFEELKEEFGKQVPSIFTDEPQTTHKGMMVTPFSKEQVVMPFTDDFEETFAEKKGYSILEHLPELFWEKRDGVSKARYDYHAHVLERFSESFGDNIGAWCRQHHIALTGHMMSEWTLYSQTLVMGDVMRPMMNFGIPGIDMLCDRRELSTAKQAASVSRQMGREGVMSELYGVTGWGFDFRNHKLAGDWQAALGVTFRVPHLTWASMEGEGKRDYPASIGYQSPWYREYACVEDHFARVNTVMTRGKAKVAVGVIHPVESYWLNWGNKGQTAMKRMTMEENFEKTIEWLLYGLIDFDFISEAMLAEQKCGTDEGKFRVGEMAYQVILIPGCETLRRNTFEKLKEFQLKGGMVYLLGSKPSYIEAEADEELERWADSLPIVPFNQSALLAALDTYRDIDIDVFPIDGDDPTRVKHKETGNRANNMFYQMREDNRYRWLFITHVNKQRNENIAFSERCVIKIRGNYRPVWYDTMTGEIKPLKAIYKKGKTIIEFIGSAHSSLLLRLEEGRQESYEGYVFTSQKPEKKQYFPQPDSYSLEEDNVCLLDMAKYAFDDGGLQDEEELLRIDNLFRKKLGYPLRMEALAQPWVTNESGTISNTLKLVFRVASEVDVACADLAMEKPQNVRIAWNGIIADQIEGWFVDRDILRVRLPGGIQKGENSLELEIPFGKKTNVEWCYLLGKFGVRVNGSEKTITNLPEKVNYGDFTRQNLPFYAGNLVYHTEIHTEEGELWIETPSYKGALVQVEVDGKRTGNIFMAPYQLNCGKVSAGKHQVAIRIFGNRANAFGAVHHMDDTEPWYGPNLWRTEGNLWSYEYQLEKMGVLSKPLFWVNKIE